MYATARVFFSCPTFTADLSLGFDQGDGGGKGEGESVKGGHYPYVILSWGIVPSLRVWDSV